MAMRRRPMHITNNNNRPIIKSLIYLVSGRRIGKNNRNVTSIPTAIFVAAKRPNELNQRPTLGHTQTARIKPNQRYREGYHYQPVASTSRQSPTFVVGDDLGAGPSTSRSNDNSSA